jgi:hypothetical protein
MGKYVEIGFGYVAYSKENTYLGCVLIFIPHIGGYVKIFFST